MDNEQLKTFITSRQTKLESLKTNFNDRMQDVADFVCPHRDDIRGTLQKGAQKGSKIFDGTAVGAAVLAADGIHGYHVSPAFPWFKYVMNKKKVNDIKEVKLFLEEVEYVMYLTLTKSNFYTEIWSFIYDGFTIGTAAIFPEEDLLNDRISFETVHPGEIYISENRFGEVDVLHRKVKLSAKKLVERFGKENVTELVRNSYASDPFSEFEVLHAVYPREEFDSKKLDAKNKKFASVWLLTQGSHVLSESGFDQFPYRVWRYLKTGKEPYGTSPAHLAMSDIKGLNLIGKTLLGAAQLSVNPAYTLPSYLYGKAQLAPNGLNYLDNPNDKILPVNTGSNFPIGLDREESKQRSIKERFHVDTFLMLASLEGKGQRTAYEVSELMAEKAAVLGAELGAFNLALDGLLDSVYSILAAKAIPAIPQIPDILLEMAQEDNSLRFDPVYMGPLAQAQRERFSKDGIRKFIDEMVPLINLQVGAGIQVDVLDNFNFDEAGRVLADINRLPGEILRSREEVALIRQQKMQAQMMAQQQEESMGALEGLKTASEADRNLGGKLSEAMMAGGMPGVA